MGSDYKKKNILLDTDDETRSYLPIDTEQEDEPRSSRSREAPTRKIRKVNPVGFRVLVRILKDSNVSDGGLYLPEGAKQNMMESLLAKVVEVASATDNQTDEETNVSGIPLHAHVLIPKHAGVKIPWDENLRLVDTKEVLAVVNEISIL